MTERNQRIDPAGPEDNEIEQMESKRRRHQQRQGQLLARLGMNQRADDLRKLKESNAGGPEPDSPMGQLWSVAPKPARDFLSAGPQENAVAGEPVLSDDSEFEDSDGVPVF